MAETTGFWGGWRGRRGTSHTQTPFDGGFASHPFVGSDVQSVGLKPDQVGLQILSPSRPAPAVLERPWTDIETFVAYMRQKRNRIRRHWGTRERTLQDLEPSAPGLTSSPSTSTPDDTPPSLLAPPRNRKGESVGISNLHHTPHPSSSLGLTAVYDHPVYDHPVNNAQVGSSQDNIPCRVSGSSTNSSSTSSQPEYPLPPRQFYSAVSIKDGLGELQPILMYYDTMSTDNGVSEKLVSSHQLTPRPILPKNLKTYTTANGDFTPTHYVEVLLKDPNKGIKEYTKVVCSVWPSMQGYGLIGGLEFIHEHKIVLDPTRPSDIYVTTGKKADASARENQKKVYKSAEKDNKLAKALLLASTSTAGSLTAGTEESRKNSFAASSQTSTQPDSQIGSSKKF